MRKIFPVNKKASKASFPGFILPTSPVPILSSISQHPPLVTNASWLLVEIPTYSDTVSVLKNVRFQICSRVGAWDAMVRATRRSLPPHLLCSRLQSHLQLPSKRPRRLHRSCRKCEHRSTASLPFSCCTYRRQTHHTSRDGCLALDTTSPFSPLPVCQRHRADAQSFWHI